MKKFKAFLLAGFFLITTAFGLTSCGGEKNITVVTRDQGSGTREAFDRVVNDSQGNYLEMKINGETTYFTTDKADLAKETGIVKTKVANDENAIGYISLGSVDDTVKVLTVNGVYPSAETVLDGSYSIQRPFVVMTNSSVTLNDITADFLLYLKSNSSKAHSDEAGCIFLTDPSQRANEGETSIPVETYVKKDNLPAGEKININGSTSMQHFIEYSMRDYAALYGVKVNDIFNKLDLQGSSEGKKTVLGDKSGNSIGLSSAAVKEDGINSFNVCLDAVAVIVNKNNQTLNDVSLVDLYNVFSGKVKKFSELAEVKCFVRKNPKHCECLQFIHI